MLRLITITLVILALAAPAGAGSIAVYAELDYYNPFIYDTGDVIMAHVVVTGFTDLTSVSFRLQMPECAGLTLLGESYGSNVVTGGSVQDGITVTFGGCRTTPHVVTTLIFTAAGISDCCYLRCAPFPDTGSLRVEAVDCAMNTEELYTVQTVIAPAGSEFYCGAPTVPANPVPADGAVDVPLIPVLEWQSEWPLGTGLGIGGNALYLGTSPPPPGYMPVWEGDLFPPWVVGPLAANTTYYWMVRAIAGDFGSTIGPVWQFTTEEAVATEHTTWSRIKALYR